MIADTHAHLADPVFDPDRAEVLRRAREAGVAPVVVVTEDLDEARRAVELAALHPVPIVRCNDPGVVTLVTHPILC